jgi:DnaJ-class molecular chaperone
MSKPCKDCKATGWTGGKAGQGNCQMCHGSGYIDRPLVDTPAKLEAALKSQAKVVRQHHDKD